MAKFNTGKLRAALGRGPIVTNPVPTTLTHEGGPGYLRDIKGELFILAVANLVGEDTFYETAGQRDTRFAWLVRTVAVEDVEWLTRFVRWLRTGANLRSTPLVAAAEAVHARLAAGVHGANRTLIAAACDRADEPGELLAYWLATYGRALPMPVKRGLADAALRLYAEYPLLKYDTGSRGVRFADVIELAHPAGRPARRPVEGRPVPVRHRTPARPGQPGTADAGDDPGERGAAGAGRGAARRDARHRPATHGRNDLGGRPVPRRVEAPQGPAVGGADPRHGVDGVGS
jgi:hypothetical protein